jgi:tetratricopeptide (TPR) repeat protein
MLVALAATLVTGTAVDAQPRSEPLTIAPTPVGIPGRRAIPPLDAFQLNKFREAQAFRQARLYDRALTTLIDLDRQVPHHPLVVTELALVHLDQRDWEAAERLGRAERAWANDSLILSHELSLALERQGRTREAAVIALEAWAATTYEAGWAGVTLQRLMAGDAKEVREAMRKTAEKLPERADLQRGRARLEWTAGDMASALRVLERADGPQHRPSIRWVFADDVLAQASRADTTMAIEALLALAGDARQPETDRLQGGRRAWTLVQRRSAEAATAPRMREALRSIPATRWDPELLVGVARGLRQAGRTQDARALLDARATDSVPRPEIELERALADLRDGPPERAIPGLHRVSETTAEARFRYAEVLFYAGMSDSALAVYTRIAEDPRAPFAGAALERAFTIEDASPRSALPALGRIAWEEWREQHDRALAIAESLYRELPRGVTWAQVSVMLSAKREQAGNVKGALEPVLALADSLPEDRLAPVARQRAGDVYLKLRDEPRALAQYEECLARYPKAWNAADVRRSLDQLRRERRF